MLTFTGNFSSNLLPTTVGGDLLISTYYASYAYFVGMPVFSKIYPYIYYEQTRDEINSIVEQNDSGWIVMDNTTGLYFSELPVETFDVNDKIVEYLGSFGDQMIWSWNRSR